MYIYLKKVDKTIIENALKSLDLKPEDYIEVIKEEECISTDNLIELIENINYKLIYVEEKLEEANERKSI